MAKPLLLPYQQAWVNDAAPLKIYLKARQIGFSFAETLAEVMECIERRSHWLVLSRGERQALELARKAKEHCQAIGAIARLHENEFVAAGSSRQPWRPGHKAGRAAATSALPGVAIAQHRLEFPNGSWMIALPANPDTARGYSANVLLDEFAFHRDARSIYAAVYPSITRGFKLRIGSTPFGESGMFYELWTGQNAFSKHRTDIFEAREQGLELDVAKLRAGCPDEEIWRQEYCCEFVSEASAWIPWELIVAAERAEERCGGPATAATSSPASQGEGQLTAEARGGGQAGLGSEFFLGADIARQRDLTVLYLVERIGDVLYTRAIERLANATFAEQQAAIEQFLVGESAAADALPCFDSRSAPRATDEGREPAQPDGGLPYHSVRRCAIDATGMGAMLAEGLQQKFGSRVEPVHFTLAVKEDLALRVKRLFEERRIRIPEDPALRGALHAVRKYATVAGHFRFDAERSERGHADEFWALALAAYAAEAGPRSALAGLDAEPAWRSRGVLLGEPSELPLEREGPPSLMAGRGRLPYQDEFREGEPFRQGFFGARGLLRHERMARQEERV